MNTFLDVDKIECVMVTEAKAEYPQVDWASDQVQGKTWDAPYNSAYPHLHNNGNEMTQIMALEDLKTILSKEHFK